MTRQIHVTETPEHTVQTLRPGRRLVTPSPLAALTWNAAPYTLNELAMQESRAGSSDDPHAVRELTALLTEAAYVDFAPPTRELLEVLHAIHSHPGVPEDVDPALHALALELDQRLRSGEPTGTAQCSSAPREPLLVHGYASLTTREVTTLSRLAGPDSVIVLPKLLATDALIARLTQQGWQLSAALEVPERVNLSDPQVMSAGDPLHEARTALALAAKCLHESEHPPRVLITARQPDQYRAALTVAAKERGVALHWLDSPYAQTSPGALLTLIATVLTENWSYETVCALLTSPALTTLTPNWSSIRKAGANSQRQWAKPGLLPNELAALWELPDRASPQDWYEAFSALPGLTDLLFELHLWMTPRLPESSDQRTYGAALKSALRRPAPSGPIPADALIIAPPEALPGARADLVLALGLTEGVWPSAPDFRPPLDAHVRAALKAGGVEVRTAVTHAHQEQALYHWAQLAAPRFIAFVPQVVGSRRQLPSDLVAEVPLLPAPPHVLIPTDSDQAPLAPSPAHPPIDLIDRRFSPTQLTRFGQCAFRWYAEYGLSLTEPQEPQRILTPDARGRLYHFTLDHVAQGLKEDPAANRQVLVDEGFAAAEIEEDLDRLLNWTWQRVEHLRHLHDLVSSDEFLPTGHRIVESEAEFVIDWNGLAVHGALDRLDHTPAGYEVTDYKTGKEKPKGAKGEGGRLTLDVQLPIYLAAAEAQTGMSVTRGRYLSLTGAEQRILGTVQLDQPGLAPLVEDLFTAADGGHFPVNPDPAHDACHYCVYAPLCRHEGVHDDQLD